MLSSDGLNEIALWLTESQLASLAHACYVRDMDRYAETHAGDYGQGDDFVCPTDCTCGHCIGRDAVG